MVGPWLALSLCWPALALSLFPQSPPCPPGWGCPCSHQSCTRTSLSLAPCATAAWAPACHMPCPHPAQPWGSFPPALHTEQLTAVAMPRAPVLSCGHPIRAARSHPRDRGWEHPAMLCAVLGEMPPHQPLSKRGTAPPHPPPQAVSVPVGCLAPPGFGLPCVPAGAFWGHRIIES